VVGFVLFVVCVSVLIVVDARARSVLTVVIVRNEFYQLVPCCVMSGFR
jgi:hypothetical protein